MKLEEIDRLRLEIADLKIQLINKTLNSLLAQQREVQENGNAIIKKFCDENNLDIKKVNINPITGEVNLIEENKEV